jgi:predicted O-methyltransferase YrrM
MTAHLGAEGEELQMGPRPTLEVLGVIEEALARHPVFADSTYILGQLQSALQRRLRAISARLPIAGQLLDTMSDAKNGALDHVIGDTVVRCAILHAHTQVETDRPHGLPLPDCEEVFAETIRRLQQGKFSTTLDDGSLPRLGPESYHGWIWNEAHSGDIFGRSFRYLVRERYGAVPRTATNDEIAVLEKGAQLLSDLTPLLAPSALRHVHLTACVPDAGGWTGTASGSQFLLGGTIFIGQALYGPWCVAEHLLHESMHQKLYDFRQGHSVQELELEFGPEREGTPRVCSPWNPQRLNRANEWDVNRVFAAFHVYVYLAHLAMVAEQRASELEDRYGTFQSMIASSTAFERAHYLGEKLKEQCWDHVGPAGKRLADWLLSVLECLNPTPPAKGAYIHLYLDHYQKEGRRVAAALDEAGSPPWSAPEKLIPLAKDEVENARSVLSTIDAQEQLRHLNEALAQYTDEELGKKFSSLRRVIATTLLTACPDGYRFTESGSHDVLLKDMVETASRHIFLFLAGYPPAVGDAKRRAHEMRFRMSCDDGVGRLLTVLAYAVPSGGRILEIGTGTGVGTGWITAGLGERTDVEVVSVEVEARLADAVRSWPWPAYVRIVTADALAVLETLGTFDLVFADAAPVKYGHIGSVLGALRPGGLLVMDDIRATSRTDEAQRTERSAMRSMLLRQPDIRAVDVDWSSGVILAAKAGQAAFRDHVIASDAGQSLHVAPA